MRIFGNRSIHSLCAVHPHEQSRLIKLTQPYSMIVCTKNALCSITGLLIHIHWALSANSSPPTYALPTGCDNMATITTLRYSIGTHTRQSCSRRVSLLSRNGTWLQFVDSAHRTFARVLKLLLIAAPSASAMPCVQVLLCRSLPAF
jgi:hypothetical protein